MERVRVWCAGVAALSLCLVFVQPPAVAAAEDVHVIPPDPVLYDDLDALMDIYGPPKAGLVEDSTATAGCGSAAANPVPDGAAIYVKIPPAHSFVVGTIPAAYWRNPPVKDPAWRLQFEGLTWARPIGRRAAMDDQQEALRRVVNQVAAFHKQNPDPKTNSYGWDEGTALRRLETENCLWALTGNETLRRGMVADANVLLSKRYYGPPYAPVHNHGLMANLQLLKAGQHLGYASWRSTAINRMVKEAPQAFSRGGVSWEQSSMYQTVNANLWDKAAVALTDAKQTSAAASVAKTVRAARIAYQWMTEPDGKIVQIGDSDEYPGGFGSLTTPRSFRDSQTGWIIGRWSWTDPKTVYYTVRTGPARRGHGQHDRGGGVTFTAKGVRVLVGPGRYSYDLKDNYNAYQLSPQSHNVALPDGKRVTNAGGTYSAFTIQGPAHAWTLKDKMFGIDHTRTVNVIRDSATMKISDSFPSSSLWRQYWHLDPQWQRVSYTSTKLVFSHPSGRRLTITTTGRLSSITKGVTRPPAGWHFPTYGTRLQANEISIRSYGRSSVTTFQVS